VMQKGLSPNATTRLPLGNPLHGYAIALEIEIIDALGAGTLDILVVMVTITSVISNSRISRFPFKCRTFSNQNYATRTEYSGRGSISLRGLLCLSCHFLLCWNFFGYYPTPGPSIIY